MAHLESCKKCKSVFLDTLRSEFGEVIEQWDSGWPSKIGDILKLPQLKKKPVGSLLKIHKTLQEHRGHTDFVHQLKLPRCDYYIKSLNCILEFDESQHFSAPRSITLSHYP